MKAVDRHRKLEKNTQPTFYKYTSAPTAKAILRTGTLRWTKPTAFNDPFEFKFAYFPEFENQKVLDAVSGGLRTVIREGLPVAANSPIGKLVNLYRTDQPHALRNLERFIAIHEEGLKAELENLRKKSYEIDELRDELEDAKILCLADKPDNILMWSHYGAGHTGVVLEFINRTWADSYFGAAQRVIYSEDLPRCYSEEEFVDLLCGRFSIGAEIFLDSIIFTKSQSWSYEREWRIIMHLEDRHTNFSDKRFNPFDLGAIILGLRTSKEDMIEICKLADRLPRSASFFRAVMRSDKYGLELIPLKLEDVL